MFDIGFSEMVVIAVVALVVVGPERLPRVARTLGLLLGRAQRYVNDIKTDVSRQIELEDMKRTHDEASQAVRAVEQAVAQELKSAGTGVETLTADVAERAPEPGAHA